MFGNVTALVGLHVTGKYRDEKHAAHMLQACGLGSSQGGPVQDCLKEHWPVGRHVDRDRVSDEMFTEAERRFPREPEEPSVCVFYNIYRTCLM